MKEERGLWIGLPLDREDISGRNLLHTALKDDSHITLVHLGRTKNEDWVQIVRRALTGVWTGHIDVEITGVGVFWRKFGPHTPVALVNSAELFNLRAKVCAALDSHDISYDQRFGFIPHITLKDIFEYDRSCYTVTRLKKLELVWGDNRITL